MRLFLAQLFALLTISTFSFAQDAKEKKEEKPEPVPYQTTKDLPAFNLLKTDSATIFNTYNIPEGKPCVLMFFSPDCEHCKMQTQNIIDKMDSLKNIHFYMMTFMPLTSLKEFSTKFKLAKYKNISLYKDYDFFFSRFYGAKFVPYFAVYDKHKKFVKLYEGYLNITELIKSVK